ncbi:MAG: helix-turn-helix domain-containing protein [Chitinophagaceae bacterium]
MTTGNTLFVSMPLLEFKELISELVKNELKDFKEQISLPKEDVFMSIEEASQFLRASKVTIHKWKKNKKITSYRIGRKIFFKKQELINSMGSLTIKKRSQD